MNTEHAPASPEITLPENATPSGDLTPIEAPAAQRPKGTLSPYSLVPALTLIAMQFVKDEPGFIEGILSSGRGGHRPSPK